MGFYHNLIDGFARTKVGGWMFLNVFNRLDRKLMRWSNGAISTGIGTEFRDNGVLLVCRGAKSGTVREIPLLTTPWTDGRYILIASATGAPKNPAWYYNLKANPDCQMLIPKRGELEFVAREAEGEDREEAWRLANEQYSGYEVYQTRTERRIPVMVLDPR